MKLISNISYCIASSTFKAISKTLAYLTGKKIEIYGRKNLPQEGAVLAINHKLAIDWQSPNVFWQWFFSTLLRRDQIIYENITPSFVGSVKIFKPVHYLVDSVFFKDKKGKSRSKFIELIEQIPMMPVKEAIKQARQYLEAKEYVGIFDGPASEPLDLTKRLCVTLALYSKKPIIPVNVKTEPVDDKRLMNVMAPEVKKILISFGKPLDLRYLYKKAKSEGKTPRQMEKEFTRFVWNNVYNPNYQSLNFTS